MAVIETVGAVATAAHALSSLFGRRGSQPAPRVQGYRITGTATATGTQSPHIHIYEPVRGDHSGVWLAMHEEQVRAAYAASGRTGPVAFDVTVGPSGRFQEALAEQLGQVVVSEPAPAPSSASFTGPAAPLGPFLPRADFRSTDYWSSPPPRWGANTNPPGNEMTAATITPPNGAAQAATNGAAPAAQPAALVLLIVAVLAVAYLAQD